MRENGHLDQTKLNDESKVMQSQELVQEELVGLGSEKSFIPIKEVVALLNENGSIESVSQKLEMRIGVLEAKLANATVKLSDDGQWEYYGGNQSESLSRNIYSRIYVKPYDKDFVTLIKNNNKEVEEPRIKTDLCYELFVDSKKIKNTPDKKSVWFEDDLYAELKSICNQEPIKISTLINTLIKKGLAYYQLK